MVWPSPLLAGDPNVRIEMERSTREEVKIAVTRFVLKKDSRDPLGQGQEARKILENDLRLSELFVKVPPARYEGLERREQGQKGVNFRAWHQVGAQWLIKTEYNVLPGGKLSFVFRLYDAVNERFLLGKRYTVGKNLFAKSCSPVCR